MSELEAMLGRMLAAQLLQATKEAEQPATGSKSPPAVAQASAQPSVLAAGP